MPEKSMKNVGTLSEIKRLKKKKILIVLNVLYKISNI